MRSKFCIYVVSDIKTCAEKIASYLKINTSWQTFTFIGVEEFLSRKDIITDSVILCYDFDKLEPFDCLRLLRKNYRRVRALHIVSESNNIDYKNYLLDEQIINVIRKDELVFESIVNHLEILYREQRYRDKIKELEKNTFYVEHIEDFVCQSPKMSKIKELVDKASSSDDNIFITGDLGTGKETISKYIHANSIRSNNNFIMVNIASIPADLQYPVFLGYEKGSFKGAVSKKIGYLELAHKGTLLLNEITDMDIGMQKKLYEFIKEQEVSRVGGIYSTKVDVRIIITTRKNIQKEIEKGTFLQELYDEFSNHVIYLPALRERKEDIVPITERFISDFCRKRKKPIKYLHNSTKELLEKSPFTANVSELKAIVNLALIMSETNIIYPEDIVQKKDNFIEDFFSEEYTLEECEVMIIRYFLRKYNNKVRYVADKLGIGKTKIYEMIKQGKIDMDNNDN